MKRFNFIYFILTFILLSCGNKDNMLVNTKWIYDYGNGYIDYIFFKDKKQYEFYSCETGETLFGTYFLNGHSLILHQLSGSYDQEFAKESRHSTPEVKFNLRIEGNFITFKEKWELDVNGSWMKSDFNFPDEYKFKKQQI